MGHKIIGEFLDNKCSLKTIIDYLNTNITLDENAIAEAIFSRNENERRYLLIILLYFVKKTTFSNYDSPFIGFLNSISLETDNDFDQQIVWHLIDEEVTLFQIDHVYFILNNSNNEETIVLPDPIKNTHKICVNCNDSLKLGEKLKLQPVEFYMISDTEFTE